MIHFASSLTVDSQSIVVEMKSRSKNIEQRFSRGIRAGTIHLQTILKRDVLSGQVLRRRSGNLSRAVISRMESPLSGLVGITREAPYARALNEGARPHIIAARNAKALAFTPAAGAIRFSAFVPKRSFRKTLAANRIFRKVVHHPGNPPYHFMELALHMATPGIKQAIQQQLKGPSAE